MDEKYLKNEEDKIITEAEAKEISDKFISSYKRNTIMYAIMILDLNATRTYEANPANADSSLNESEVEHFFLEHIKKSTGVVKQQLSRLQLPNNHAIYCDEKFASIWAQYVFLVVTNRHPKYTPKAITLDGRTKEILSRTHFDGFSKNCRQVSEELEKHARDLLTYVGNCTPAISSAGVLHYMIAFSRWMVIMDDVRQHKKCEIFVSEITEWCNLKRRADVFVKLDKEEFQVNKPWAGCAEWLTTMDCFATSRGRKIKCRILCDSLQTLKTKE